MDTKETIKAVINSEWHLPTPEAIEHLADKIAAALAPPAKPKHSPLPWKDWMDIHILDSNGSGVCSMLEGLGNQCIANRNFVLKAVNSHEKAVAFARAMDQQFKECVDARGELSIHRKSSIAQMCREALAAAGEQP